MKNTNGFFELMTDDELFLAVKELQKSELNGIMGEKVQGLIKSYYEMADENHHVNYNIVVQMGLYKEAANRWVDSKRWF